MRKNIEKQILRNVEEVLGEIDIDGIIEKYTSSKAVEEEVETMVKEKIARYFEDAVLKSYRDKQKFIDSWAADKLTKLLIELGVK